MSKRTPDALLRFSPGKLIPVPSVVDRGSPAPHTLLSTPQPSQPAPGRLPPATSLAARRERELRDPQTVESAAHLGPLGQSRGMGKGAGGP